MESNLANDVKETRPATVPAEKREPTDKAAGSKVLEKPARSRRWLVRVIVIALAFGLGFVPMWLKAGRHAGERDSAERQVRRLQLEALAAGAAIDARRGEYEPARQATSQFFTVLLGEFDVAPRSSLSLTQQDALKSLLAHRDNLITLLARSDPASAEKLTGVYLTCRKSLRGD